MGESNANAYKMGSIVTSDINLNSNSRDISDNRSRGGANITNLQVVAMRNMSDHSSRNSPVN
jgi:hypothetical protein